MQKLFLSSSIPQTTVKRLLALTLRSLSFKELMLKARLLDRRMRHLIETKIDYLCRDRLLYYNMKPGYIMPQRYFKIIQLTNRVHIYCWHYWPDYNQWFLNYIMPPEREATKQTREVYLVIDELDSR